MSSQDDAVHMCNVLSRNSTSDSIQIPGTVQLRFFRAVLSALHVLVNQLTSFITSFALGTGVDTLPLWSAPPSDPSSRSKDNAWDNVKLWDFRSH
jgi:hypothetical protein